MIMNNMSNAEFDVWIFEQSTTQGQSEDERLIQVVSKALREDTREGRAQTLVDAANLCMAMADKALGSQVAVRTCVTLTRH